MLQGSRREARERALEPPELRERARALGRRLASRHRSG